eukprot:8824455-Heterocapsa_arctica.AAC.1
MRSLVLAHDRELQCLRDRVSWLAILKDRAVIDDVLALRERWRELEDVRRAGAPAVGRWPGHPLGSLRAIIFAAVAEAVAAEPGEDAANLASKQAARVVGALGAAAIEECIFRLRPRHAEPADGKPWTWEITLAQGCTADLRTALSRMAEGGGLRVRMAPMRSVDGPLSVQLRGGKGGAKGGGKGAAGG